MSELPRVIAGQPVTEEHFRIFEAYLREHEMPVAGQRMTEKTLNAAIDWWNALDAQAPLAEQEPPALP